MYGTGEHVRQVTQIYLLFKDERHGERDGLEKQQHTENTEELQREEK